MRKDIELKSVRELAKMYDQINFPEYQRESTVWSLDAKQRLVDSISREFDIASLYFYIKDDYMIDCVDGRQRIGAIMSFIGLNQKDEHNKFKFRILNELYEDLETPYNQLEGLTYTQIEQKAQNENHEQARTFLEFFMNYKITIIKLSESQEHNEFNLQFARLNLGVIINSGEKLNAMVGDLRNVCFDDLGRHPFLKIINIPERRYAREQTVAQILGQVFSVEDNRQLFEKWEFARMRHFDLQKLFKVYTNLGSKERAWIEKVKNILSLLESAREDLSSMRSRALVVSLVMLAYAKNLTEESEAVRLGKFMKEFSRRLQWQIKKGLDVDSEYRYLVDFQKHVTQASVEKPAVTARAEVLEEEFTRWKKTGKLRGDEEYEKRTGLDASSACASDEGQKGDGRPR